MLKSVHSLLHADLLYALAAMGHGDDLVVVDRNFPGEAVAAETRLGHLLRLDRPAAEVVEAILSVFPLDTFVEDSLARMELIETPEALAPVQAEVQAVIDGVEGHSRPMIAIERFAFYERAKQAFAIVQTSEPRFFGCFAFRKGVIGPEA